MENRQAKKYWGGAKNIATHLQLLPGTVNPGGIVSHAIDVCEGLDSAFDIASNVENAVTTVQEVRNRGLRIEGGRISKNSVVPSLEVRVIGDKVRESLPLVGGGNEAGTVGANGSRAWVRWLEGIRGPCEI